MVNMLFRHLSEKIFLPVISWIINHTPWFIWALLDFVIDISFFWVKRLYRFYKSESPLKVYSNKLKTTKNYNEWRMIAERIDKLTNIELWRQNFISKHYDYVLINERLKLLREARKNEDTQLIMSLFRAGLIRNFGGISQKRLYIKSYLGTKYIIEEYVEEVLNCLNYLNETIDSPTEREGHEYITDSRQLKINFFHDARQSFGCTALVLQGGSLFGLCHLGVVRALYFKGLLPNIIGGSAVGAAVASLVCTLEEHELIPILISIVDVMGDIDGSSQDIDERYGNIIENVVKKGYSQDILIFLKFVRDTIGDITFEKAYLKTNRVLNVVIHPDDRSVPSLLNYVTAPNVIIWTAIYASIGTGVLSDDVKLYVKNFKDEIVPRYEDRDIFFSKPENVTYLQLYFSYLKGHKNDKKGTANERRSATKGKSLLVQSESPYTRLTELFNVNHFIISLARPYLAPLINNDMKHYNYSYKRVNYNSKENGHPDQSMDRATSEDPSTIDIYRATASDIETYKEKSYNFMKLFKSLVGMEIQYRLEVLNKLGLLSNLVKRICIDEKAIKSQTLLSIREIAIIPELKYLMKDFGRVFEVHKLNENIPYWVLVGERSVWPLFPILKTRCAIEFALDDLYNIHKNVSD